MKLVRHMLAKPDSFICPNNLPAGLNGDIIWACLSNASVNVIYSISTPAHAKERGIRYANAFVSPTLLQ